MRNRNIILGIDGVPFELMDKLSDKGFMTNFKELKEEYTFRQMRSSIPAISSVSWSSMTTGKNPGAHGIYGFSHIIKNTYTLNFPNFNALKSLPFWLQDSQKKHIIINVPSTYPAKKLNGIHIAGFVALDLEKAVYPQTFVKTLKDMNYEVDIDAKLAKQQSKESFLNELFRILKIRKSVFDLLWKEPNWDNYLAVITGSDRLGHYLWHAYEDTKNEYHQKFIEYFQEIDKIIGDFKKKLEKNDNFIILSDHGMELIEYNVNLNTYLEKEGYLKLSNDSKNYNRIQKDSKAFVLDAGRVYLNKKDEYPNGSINKKDEKKTIEELKNLLYELKFNNKKVIKKVYEKEEIYSGNAIDAAPDLVLIENKGFNLKGSIGKKDIFEREKELSGKHNENAFIFINKEINQKELTIENVLGLLR